ASARLIEAPPYPPVFSMSGPRSQAIVTLVDGDRYRTMWRRYAEPQWKRYADRHELDVIALDRPLDDSPRARGRSPAWQKLLVLSQGFSSNYERVIWIDSDVAINPAAPLVSERVPAERVGATEEFSFPTAEQHALAVRRLGEAAHLPSDLMWVTP